MYLTNSLSNFHGIGRYGSLRLQCSSPPLRPKKILTLDKNTAFCGAVAEPIHCMREYDRGSKSRNLNFTNLMLTKVFHYIDESCHVHLDLDLH